MAENGAVWTVVAALLIVICFSRSASVAMPSPRATVPVPENAIRPCPAIPPEVVIFPILTSVLEIDSKPSAPKVTAVPVAAFALPVDVSKPDAVSMINVPKPLMAISSV